MLSRLAAVALLLVLNACSPVNASGDKGGDPVVAPTLGACRVLVPQDLARPTNNTDAVACGSPHTAENFLVREFPQRLAARADVEDPALGAYVYKVCSERFQAFLDSDESTVMRSMLSWAWYRPTEKAWRQGARWYRCDVVSGTEHSEQLRQLPKTTEHVLLGEPEDEWMACANGDTVADSPKVPCSEPHSWRAVTTIQLGGEDDAYPGESDVRARTEEYCGSSVVAWLDYPVDYDFGYTFFGRADWLGGNRRSICWAKTQK